MKKMHIGIVGYCNPYELRYYLNDSDEVESINEAATSVTTYVKELLRNDYTVSLFTAHPNHFGYKEYHGNHLHVYEVPTGLWISRLDIISRLFVGRRIKKVIKKHFNELDVIHSQWTYDFAYATKSFADKIPVFCTVRDWCPYQYSIAKSLGEKTFWLASLYIFKKVMSSKHIHFIANSDYTYNCLANDYPDKKIALIYNPIYKDFIIKEKKKNISKPVFITICQSVDETRKNIYTLLKAFSKFKNENNESELIVIGNYNQNSGLHLRAQKENLISGVRFVGKVLHDDLFNYIDDSTCLVHPSWEETFGNILLEAMARRIVCIGGNDAGAVPQVLEKGECGILCDVHSEENLYEALVMSQKQNVTEKMINNATEKLLSVYSSDINMELTISEYLKYN